MMYCLMTLTSSARLLPSKYDILNKFDYFIACNVVSKISTMCFERFIGRENDDLSLNFVADVAWKTKKTRLGVSRYL